ncbi:unnamed protein product [Prorocentrum cordatum]|uniref:Uncharacterized protein n=1 Tax=Prorocentrum cordatum TaxID=2364126 RepID=A0ABN9W9P9_9DINO|nr:unnamed protein product [Polarella glacialis]
MWLRCCKARPTDDTVEVTDVAGEPPWERLPPGSGAGRPAPPPGAAPPPAGMQQGRCRALTGDPVEVAGADARHSLKSARSGEPQVSPPGAREGPGKLPLQGAVEDPCGLPGEIVDDATACGTEGVASSSPSSPSHVRLDVVGTVGGALGAADRPDFTGSWQCIRVEGDMHRFLQHMGLSPIMCEAAKNAHYGAGHQLQTISQEGDFLSVVDQLKVTVTMKCQVGLGPQRSFDLEGRSVTVTPTWDGQTLCVETTTGSGEPFATSRRFYEGDEMVLELTSPAGATTRRIFCRKGSTRHLKSIRSTCSTRLTWATEVP